MIKIRLARTGRKKLPHYRVVVSDSRRTPTGAFIAQLGHYNPHTKEFVIDAVKTQEYIDNGVQPSSRMVRLLKDHKDIKLPDWAMRNLVEKQRPKKKPQEAPAEASGQPKETKEPEAEDTPEDTNTAEAEPKEAEEKKVDETKEEEKTA